MSVESGLDKLEIQEAAVCNDVFSRDHTSLSLCAASPAARERMDDELAGRMLFAIPKKGRLYDKIVALLKDIDIQYKRKNRLDVALCTNHPIAIVFLPASDIATF